MGNYPKLEAIGICTFFSYLSKLKSVNELNEKTDRTLHARKIVFAKNEVQIKWHKAISLKIPNQGHLERLKGTPLNL